MKKSALARREGKVVSGISFFAFLKNTKIKKGTNAAAIAKGCTASADAHDFKKI